MGTITKNTSQKELVDSFQIKKALVGFDLTTTDDAILTYLAFLRKYIPIKAIQGIHVLPSFDLFNALFFGNEGELEGAYFINREVEQKIDSAFKKAFDTKDLPDFEIEVSEGDPLEEMLDLTRNAEPDLLVIGKNVRPDNYGILPKNLVRKLECNALIIPEKVNYQLKTIMVPIDFSKYSILALEKAIAIAKQMEQPAKIIAMHVYAMPNMSAYKTQHSMGAFKKIITNNIKEAFSGFIDQYNKEGLVDVEMVLIEREFPGIAKFLMENAKKRAVDLVVMGVKGHSKVELLLMGSVTEKLLSINNSIPTLVIKN